MTTQYIITNTCQATTEAEREKARLAAAQEIYRELLKYTSEKKST